MSDNTVNVSRITYAGMGTDDSGALMAALMADGMNPADILALMGSSDEVSDDHAKILGWVREFILTVVGIEGEVLVTRPKRRGGLGTLDSFLASLNGHQYSPDDVVSVCDDQGDEVYVTVGRGDDKREIKLVDNRGEVDLGLMVRLTDGTVHYCKDARGVTSTDVGGDQNLRLVDTFSRDGGETWHPVVVKVTIPRIKN